MARRLPKRTRMWIIIISLLVGGGALGLILYGMGDGLYFFISPTEAKLKHNSNQKFRIGGLVAPGSLKNDNAVVYFDLTDNNETITIKYNGILPDLFREGQGIVAMGGIKDGVFIASEVLAKHDEKYMPPEAVDALKKAGEWRGDPK